MTSSAALRLQTQAHVARQDLGSFLNKRHSQAASKGRTRAVRLKDWALGCSDACTGWLGLGQWRRPGS